MRRFSGDTYENLNNTVSFLKLQKRLKQFGLTILFSRFVKCEISKNILRHRSFYLCCLQRY